MIAFGFIENFFFISLALVFVLVLLLVYHFKNRITVAEKKSDSMYGLLTAVVKEIKTLRGMFGLGGGGTVEPDTSKFELKSKTTPEVNVSASSNETPNNKFASFVEKNVVEQAIQPEPREVITLEFAASDNKIVVSDVDESDSENDESSDYDEDSDEESVASEQENKDANAGKDETLVIDNVQEIVEPESNESAPTLEQVQEIDISTILSVTIPEEIEVNLVETAPAPEQLFTSPQVPSIEQLRKMNINQLKTIASQHGISTDISKMKKPELISLIRGGNDA